MEHPSGQLSRVIIKGFKSIKNCDIPLGRINVLIGSNGAGKSNFISVFDFFAEYHQRKSSTFCKPCRCQYAVL